MSPLIQSDPSVDDGFNISAFSVEGQLHLPNQVPGDVLQLYHELNDMEQKVKALENEIAVYVVSTQKRNSPGRISGVIPLRRKSNNVSRSCCVPGLWTCARPNPVMNDKNQNSSFSRPKTFPAIRRETYQRSMNSKPANMRLSKKSNSVSTAVQTTNFENRGSRLSKVSWDSKVDVRYIGSGIHSENPQRAPLQGSNTVKRNRNGDLTNNLVHLKIKIPKDVLNLNNSEGGTKRLENEWSNFNSSILDKKIEDKTSTSTYHNEDEDAVSSGKRQKLEQEKCRPSNCTNRKQTDSSKKCKPNYVLQMNLGGTRENVSSVASPSIVHNDKEGSVQPVGIPIKKPGKPVCESQGCTCKGSVMNDQNLEKVRQSFDMTESELSILEEAVHKKDPGPMELKIRTEYGSVNVVSHDLDCRCKICETFGSQFKLHRKHTGRSDSATVISKKIIRVRYNGDYRNVITHTEECGCDICSNIEEHAHKLKNRRASIVSTHQGDLIVKNKGICGCKNCKTVELGPHAVDVEMMLSKTSSHVLDQCYYSEATIPSMQSFPREITITADDQEGSFSSLPSITSSDLNDDMTEVTPSSLDVFTSDDVDQMQPTKDTTDIKQPEPARETNVGKCGKCQNSSKNHGIINSRNNINNFVKPSSAKSSPAELDKSKWENEIEHYAPCINANRKSRKDNNTICLPVNQSSTPIEHIPKIDCGESIQANVTNVPPIDKKADKDTSSHTADHITLENLIRDLIHGHPSMNKDKVYMVTLGEVANKAYTKIHVVDYSPKSTTLKENKVVARDKKEPIKLPGGDGTNSNVFFIKPLPRNISGSHTASFGSPDIDVSKDNCTNNPSLSSPAYIQEPEKSATQTFLKGEGMPTVPQNPDVTSGTEFAQSTSETDLRSDVPRSPFKLTISFGRRVVSFFKQRGKKKSISTHSTLTEHRLSLDNTKCRKAFHIYDGVENQSKHMELLRIEVKPQLYTMESNSQGEESQSPFMGVPICVWLRKTAAPKLFSTL